MKRLFVAAAIGVVLLILMGRARAQGFQLERYEPASAGSWFFAVQHPWYSSTRYFAAGVTLDYAHNALLGGYYSPDFKETAAIVQHQLVGHVDVAGSFLDRVQLSGSLPVTLLERGTAAFGVAPIGGGAVGDPRFGVMVRLWGQPDRSPVSIHLGSYLWIPVGNAKLHAGDDEVRALPEVVLAGLVKKHLRYAFNGGVLIRHQQTIGFGPANTAASELQLGAALAWADVDRRYSVGPELLLGTQIAGPNAFKRYGTSLELLVGGQYNIAKQVQVGLAVGAGLATDIGTPDARVIFRVAYAPIRNAKPSDRDSDGVPDAEDLCPSEPGTARGCPDADRDGVPDAQDLCPRLAPGSIPDTSKPGCPKDSDSDGVPDAEDLCPSLAPGSIPDTSKPGCPKDSDNDGVPDAEDQCPSLPPGSIPDTSKPGCPKDSDNDGVPDAEDVCPNRPPGSTPDAEKKGCPAPDSDNDGIADQVDACPKDPGVADPDPKKNGCPRLTLEQGMVLTLHSVHFETNKWELLPESFPILDEVARVLRGRNDIDQAVVEGHADDRGTHEWNQRLSRHRAEAVVDYLVNKGVRASRLKAVGFGDTRPLVPGTSEEARAQNRRVEVHIPPKK
jgi:outer membrane protein OmpA-like peptidoglycan-associated protein